MFTTAMEWIFKNGKHIFITALFIGFAAAFGWVTYQASAKTVTLVKGEKSIEITTHADTIEALLEEQGYEPGDHDVISPGKTAELENGETIKWAVAHQINLKIGNSVKTVYATSDDVAAMLKKQGITLGEHDAVSPAPSAGISDNMTVSVKKAFPVQYAVGKEKTTGWTTAATVQDFLDQEQIKLDENDIVKPAPDSTLHKNTVISVIRVDKKTEEVPETLDYKTIRKADPDLAKGETKVVQPGHSGRVTNVYAITTQESADGVKTSKELLDKKVTEKSEPKIIAYGTKEKKQSSFVQTLSYKPKQEKTSRTPSKPKPERKAEAPEGKTMVVKSSSYTADCAGCSGYTTTGFNLKAHPDAKIIAVDPNVIPIGSKVYVEGYGYARAADTGGAITGKQIDVFFSSKAAAYSWGVKSVKIRIVD